MNSLPRYARVPVDRYRVNVPAGFVAQLPWIVGTAAIPVWLFLADAGRYRVVPENCVSGDPLVKAVLERIQEVRTDVNPLQPENSASAGLVFRLVPSNVSRRGSSGWRLTLPSDLLCFSSVELSGEVVLVLSEGCLEVWTSECVGRVAAIPLERIL